MMFRLADAFVEKYKNVKPPFGFNGLGELVFLRTYSALKDDGSKEKWYETCRRVIEGCYSIQKEHIQQYKLGWNEKKAQRSAEEMFDRMFTIKWLPPGRGIANMGRPLVNEQKVSAVLYNCSNRTTGDIDKNYSAAFRFVAEASLHGIGVGYDLDGAGKVVIKRPESSYVFNIPDTRWGWADAIAHTIDAYLKPGADLPLLDYSLIRPEGSPIKSFGGIAPGPKPLRETIIQISTLLERDIGKPISSRLITDIMNLIGRCVVSGGARRSALLSLGEAHDEDYMSLKDYAKNPERAAWGWASNNSIKAVVGMDYSKHAELTALNGEPGYIWLDNARTRGRFADKPDNKDKHVTGFNPCSEIPLFSSELCNVSECFPNNHDSKEDFLRTLKFVYLYNKTVTLMPLPWEDSNRVQLKNRRIGVSLSGVVQCMEKLGMETFRDWCETGYSELKKWDEVYSDWFGIPRSIRLTTIKPAGSVALLGNATPGVHFPYDEYYIRRVRINRNQKDIINSLNTAGYVMYPAPENPEYDVVVEYPIYANCSRTTKNVSIWEKASVAAFLQRHWADNAVSVTVDFDPATEANQIEPVLNHFQYHLKAISFLPRETHGYAAPPYEAITKEQYAGMMARIKAVTIESSVEAVGEKFCTSDACTII